MSDLTNEKISDEQLITLPVTESEEQRKARIKLRLPLQHYSFTAVGRSNLDRFPPHKTSKG